MPRCTWRGLCLQAHTRVRTAIPSSCGRPLPATDGIDEGNLRAIEIGNDGVAVIRSEHAGYRENVVVLYQLPSRGSRVARIVPIVLGDVLNPAS